MPNTRFAGCVRPKKDRVQDVDAGEPAIVNETCLEQRLPHLRRLQRLLEHLIEVGHARADLDAAGVKGFSQSADLMALIEDGLRGGVRLRNPILVVVNNPQEPAALAAPKEFGLRDLGPLR